MPNASRYLEPGYTYHLTHRCHDRRFLLKFARDRDDYRKWLREGARRYHVPVYNYCITSNHVHVIVYVDDASAVASMMRLVAATVARHWNRRKQHEGSMWEHPYRCTKIQDGTHLLRCLWYVSLNMVRAGAVDHPGSWKWCGHDELSDQRSRYTILSTERLLQNLAMPSFQVLKEVYESGIEDMIASRQLTRVAAWTEALAIGNREFVECHATNTCNRSFFKYETITAEEESWAVGEGIEPYAFI